MRASLLLLMALGPSASAVTVALDAPTHAPTDGTPFDVFVRLGELGPWPVELKAWLGGEEWQASRTWNGSAWVRSDRYVLTAKPNEAGEWTAWVGLSANPDSANAPRLAGAERALVAVRVRGPEGTSDARATVALVTAPRHVLVGVPAGAAAEARDGGTLVAHATNPLGRAGVVDLAVPPEFAGSICAADRCAAASGVLLDAVGTNFAVLYNAGPDAATLEGAVLVLESGACALAGELAPGARLLVGALDGGPLAALPRLPCESDERHAGAPDLTHFGAVLDRAPDPPGWGAAVREPWGERRWAAWRLADGMEPAPLTPMRVRGSVAAFATRASGLETVLGVVDGARERLTVVTYLFTNVEVERALVAAAARGVEVLVLVEPDPVGGRPPEEDALLGRLRAAGVRVDWLEGPWSARGVQHAKVIVADGAVLLVLTENLTGSGLPLDGEGNVGWGIGLANATLARRVEALFSIHGPSRGWAPDGWAPFDADVVLLMAPENAWRSEGVPAWIEEARGPIAGLTLTANPRWGSRPNPWFGALANASARGDVRVLFNGVRGDGAVDLDNDDALAYLSAHPAAGALDARLSLASQGTIHAKGIVTSRWVLVGSSNWGAGGALVNREVNLAVFDPDVAATYFDLFNRTWNGEPGAVPPMAELSLPAVAPLFAAAVAARVGHLIKRSFRRL